MRPTTANTLVAHEERDTRGDGWRCSRIRNKNWRCETPQIRQHRDQHKNKTRSSSLSRFPPGLFLGGTRHYCQLELGLSSSPLYDDYDSDNGNNNADNEILEAPRGHAVFRRMSGSSLVSDPVLRMAEIPKRLSSTPSPMISPRSSILPIFPSPNIPLSYPPHSQPGSRSRSRTAPTGFTTPLFASVPTSRPGTGDSAIRHHIFDSIRSTAIPHGHVQGHRTPPTRDISPSRSVRFVDGEC